MTLETRHGVRLTEAQRLELFRRLVEGGTASRVAAELRINPTSALRARRELMAAGLKALSGPPVVTVPAVPPPVPEPPAERHDAAFWRRKAEALAREKAELHAVVREIGGLDGLRVGDASWLPQASVGRHGSAVLIVHNSDRHMGEVVEASEVNGWNRFDPDICRARVQRFMDAACEIGRRWTADTTVAGILYTMAGDEISGEIHDELAQTNALTSIPAVEAAVALHVACLRRLVAEYGRVHVVAVPGNHGRTTRKPTAKRIGALSYDILVAKLTARELRDEVRITWDIAAGADAVATIHGRRILVTHGDRLGTQGGQGFLGRIAPIVRGAHKVRQQYAGADDIYLILHGHFHYSASVPGVLSNGSVIGLSEYGFGLRGKPDTPQQSLALLKPRWGLAEQLAVQLEEPPRPMKPRVRASME